jgi:hypothetical protein
MALYVQQEYESDNKYDDLWDLAIGYSDKNYSDIGYRPLSSEEWTEKKVDIYYTYMQSNPERIFKNLNYSMHNTIKKEYDRYTKSKKKGFHLLEDPLFNNLNWDYYPRELGNNEVYFLINDRYIINNYNTHDDGTRISYTYPAMILYRGLFKWENQPTPWEHLPEDITDPRHLLNYKCKWSTFPIPESYKIRRPCLFIRIISASDARKMRRTNTNSIEAASSINFYEEELYNKKISKDDFDRISEAIRKGEQLGYRVKDMKHCMVSDWSGEWGACSENCGGGVETQMRTVVTQQENGGAECPDLIKSRPCNQHECRTDVIPAAGTEAINAAAELNKDIICFFINAHGFDKYDQVLPVYENIDHWMFFEAPGSECVNYFQNSNIETDKRNLHKKLYHLSNMYQLKNGKFDIDSINLPTVTKEQCTKCKFNNTNVEADRCANCNNPIGLRKYTTTKKNKLMEEQFFRMKFDHNYEFYVEDPTNATFQELDKRNLKGIFLLYCNFISVLPNHVLPNPKDYYDYDPKYFEKANWINIFKTKDATPPFNFKTINLSEILSQLSSLYKNLGRKGNLTVQIYDTSCRISLMGDIIPRLKRTPSYDASIKGNKIKKSNKKNNKKNNKKSNKKNNKSLCIKRVH